MNKYNKKNRIQQYSNSPLVQEILELIATKTNYQPRLKGGGFITRCPAHDDKNPSLSISEGYDGRVLFKCFRGCMAKDICFSIGIKLRDLFPKKACW